MQHDVGDAVLGEVPRHAAAHAAPTHDDDFRGLFHTPSDIMREAPMSDPSSFTPLRVLLIVMAFLTIASLALFWMMARF